MPSKKLTETVYHRRATFLAMFAALVFTIPVILFGQQPQKRTTTGPRHKIPVPHAPIRPVLPSADRSQPNKVFLEYSDVLTYDEIPGVPKEDLPQILKGNVKLRKGGMWMYCDSAYFFEKTSSFDAFGNVKMTQGDTLSVSYTHLRLPTTPYV